MTGKEKCELLKAIRKNIAEMNGIEYYPEQCDHEGNCPGFCPRCDQEASYLMRELKKKEAAGSPIRIDTESLAQFETLTSEPIEDDDDEILMGMPEPPMLDGIVRPLQGDVAMPDDFEDEVDLNDNEDEEDAPEPIDGEQMLKENRNSIDELCSGCQRFETISATDKGIRCSCLSEHFFLGMLEKKHCSLKK